MREYKHRGKRKDNGFWVYGNVVQTKYGVNIVDDSKWYEVDPETVGQYITEGKYEGDVIEFEDMGEEGYEYKEGYDFTNRAVIVFENGRFTLDEFIDTNSGVLEEIDDHEGTYSVIQHGRVVGNRWDNPELLGG